MRCNGQVNLFMNGPSETVTPAMQPDHIDHIPRAIADISPRDIKTLFPRPTLITLNGVRDETLFLSTLLHGNETSSFALLQYLEARYRDMPPPRSMLIFVGNVDAAAQGRRRLEHQQDFNRIWSHGTSAYHALAQAVIATARHSNLFASIDVHNNTGSNPYYGCINALRPADLQLASLFAPISVFYRNPSTTQSIAFSELCPAITLECGQSGEPDGLEAAIQLVETVLELDSFATSLPDKPVQLFETIGRVIIDTDCSIAFNDGEAELNLRAELETLNFTPIQAGHIWGTSTRDRSPLRVVNEHGDDITGEFFSYRDGEITLCADTTPSMITFSLDAIRQDCLCYLMQTVER